ncbi:acylphosphatase [archaeon]|jgi:acylphosphatase|nr:acylphosphatase [Candidatus Woesearchaeota archaeon]MBT4135863.1 acylphosphatase [archaeon]MBT4242223.1 acylphosphatase [archaeon]MBT4417911.1 acylphosphatase [archaeon]
MKTLRIYVSGSVQGVFFRKFIKDNADKLNVRGFVRNLEDGRVEILLEGKDDNVKEMLGVCKTGPKHADIKNMEIREIRHQDFKGFKVMRL